MKRTMNPATDPAKVALEKRVEDLEKMINKNSSNSDRPPSSDNHHKNKDKKRSVEKDSFNRCSNLQKPMYCDRIL